MATQFDNLRFVAESPATEWLAALAAEPRRQLTDIARERGEESPHLLAEFFRRNLSAVLGGEISARGHVCFVCIEGIEGASALELIDRLRDLDPSTSRITVVREGMTTEFVNLIGRMSDIRRLMICSPWVNLDPHRHRKLVTAIEMSQRIRGFRPEITVVTRPWAEQPNGEENKTLNYISRANGVIHFVPHLHSKLYIVEAGQETIARVAFVGSENFTRVRYEEIGLRVVNDNQLIDELVRHFLVYAGS